MAQFIVVLSKIPKLSSNIQKHLPKIKIVDINEDDSSKLSILNEAEIIIGDCDLLAEHVKSLTRVKWVQSTWAGVDSAINSFRQNNVSFLFTRFSNELFGRAMTEYVIAQIYNHERNQRKQYENQSKAIWNDNGKIKNHRLIQDLLIGILGIGSIGIQIANILKAMGATIWGLKRTISKDNINSIDKYVTINELPIFLRNCDYVINLLPSTEESRGLLNGNCLKECQQKGTVFINIGRGSIIKESDLINALEQKWLSAAILDVFEEEPLLSNSKLWLMPQVTISPHISGVSRPQDVAEFFVKNYLRYINGEKLYNIVNLEKGY